MKKSILFFAALAALFSCAKENPVVAPVEETFSVTLSADAPTTADTKTTLVDGGNYVHWSKGDAIKVQFFANTQQSQDVTGSNGVFTSYFTEDASASANFRNEAWSWGGITEWNYTSRLKSKGIALYPHTVVSSSESKSGNTSATSEISFTLPSEQTAINGNIESGLNFSYAEVNRDAFWNLVNKKGSVNLEFNNACALIQLTMPASLNGKELDYIAISSNSNVSLTGKGNVDLTAGQTEVASPFHVTPEVTPESATVKLMAPISAGETYYAVVWPGVHNDGLTLSFCATDGTTATVTTKAVELKASHVKPYKISSTLDFVSAQRDYKYYYANGEMGDDPNPTGTSVAGVIIYHGNPKEQFNDPNLPDTYCHGLAISVSSRKCAWNSTQLSSIPASVKLSGSTSAIADFSMGGYTATQAFGANNYTVFDNGTAPAGTSGWYLGAANEWKYILANKDKINSLLEGVGDAINPTLKADAFWLPYFYSTRAAIVYISGGAPYFYYEQYYYYPTYPSYCYYARPIFAF